MIKNPIFCAIDTTDLEKAKSLIGAVAPYVGGIKLGLEFFTHHGAEGVKRVMPEGTKLFLDLKFHDIPNTVAGAVRALGNLNIFMTTIHTSGGYAMMQAAKEAAMQLPSNPKVLGVTVLTSLEEKDMETLGVQLSVGQQVEKLAMLAKAAGIDGVVCSPHETANLRKKLGSGMLLVIPGIRQSLVDDFVAAQFTQVKQDDQKRVMTAKDAMAAGASYLVIGRPITGASDPAAAAKAIFESLSK